MKVSAMRVAPYALFLLAALPGASLAADTTADAQAWLDRMAQAVQSLNYDGTFIYQHGDHMEAMRIVHFATENGERERLVSLTGAPREIVRENNRLTCYLADRKSVMVEHSKPRKPFPAALPAEASARLARYYAFELAGNDRVANQETRVVLIKPRDHFRYGYRFWLDSENALPLKSDLLDEGGNVVEQMMFTSFRLLKDASEAELEPQIDAEGFTWYSDEDAEHAADAGAPAAADEQRWQVARLPEGFALVHYNRHGMPPKYHPVDHLLFSDGLASVSVYVEDLDPERKVHRGASRRGAVSAFGAVLGEHQVMVVGEVPLDTVRMIGESVQRLPSPPVDDAPAAGGAE